MTKLSYQVFWLSLSWSSQWWPSCLVKYSDYHYHDLHNDDRQNLRHWPVGQERGPCHVSAHCAWIYLIIIMKNTIAYFNEITISLSYHYYHRINMLVSNSPGISAWPAVLFKVQKKLSAFISCYCGDHQDNHNDHDHYYDKSVWWHLKLMTLGLESTVQEICAVSCSDTP